jgi:hypothetical protein
MAMATERTKSLQYLRAEVPQGIKKEPITTALHDF